MTVILTPAEIEAAIFLLLKKLIKSKKSFNLESLILCLVSQRFGFADLYFLLAIV